MTENLPPELAGPFRIDDVSRLPSGHIAIRLKLSVNHAGTYVRLFSNAEGCGLGPVDEAPWFSPGTFVVAPEASNREIAMQFAQKMLEHGLGPMVDMDFQPIAIEANDLLTVQFEEKGYVGRYR